MFAAATPAFRGIFCRSAGAEANRPVRRGKKADYVVSVGNCADDALIGSWFVVAGYACSTGSGTSVVGNRLIVERTEVRSLWSRVVDRLAGRDRYRVLWRDDQRGHTVIARRNGQRLWILSRSPEMSTRDLFQRVAELRKKGYDTRLIRYAHVG